MVTQQLQQRGAACSNNAKAWVPPTAAAAACRLAAADCSTQTRACPPAAASLNDRAAILPVELQAPRSEKSARLSRFMPAAAGCTDGLGEGVGCAMGPRKGAATLGAGAERRGACKEGLRRLGGN